MSGNIIDALKKVKENGLYLKDISEELKTAELCMEAVKKNGLALEFVPQGLKTAELCLKAVKNNGDAYQFTPEKLRTLELGVIAAVQSVGMIQYLPRDFILEYKKKLEWFKDIFNLKDSSLKEVLKYINSQNIAKALAGIDASIRNRIIMFYDNNDIADFLNSNEIIEQEEIDCARIIMCLVFQRLTVIYKEAAKKGQ